MTTVRSRVDTRVAVFASLLAFLPWHGCYAYGMPGGDADVETDDGVSEDGLDSIEDAPGEDVDAEEETGPPCGNGTLDAGETCDDGNRIEGDGCDNDCTFSCTEDAACDDGHGCTGDACNLETHACGSAPLPSGSECRPSTGDCDTPELCDGTSPDCPADVFQPSGESCDDGDDCTHLDACDGTGVCAGAAELHDAVKTAAGGGHACALLSTGEVTCWGYNAFGQLGDGGMVSMSSPVRVAGLPGRAVDIGVGEHHTCAIVEGGRLMCWGYNRMGQLGDGSYLNRLTPTDVLGLSSGVQAVSTGGWHTCALLSTGAVKCWGSGSGGTLGDGASHWEPAPVDPQGLGSGVRAVSAGETHTCVLMDAGGVKCFGYNWGCQIGDGTTTDRYVPTDVSGLASGVSSIAAGGYHSCALMGSGELRCWGYNGYGELGDGTDATRSAPVVVQGLPAPVSSMSLGRVHSCVLTGTGGGLCWGDNTSGQLGIGTWSWSRLPSGVSGMSSGATQLSAGFDSTCAVVGTTAVRCWGMNAQGQLGNRGVGAYPEPTGVVDFSSGVTDVSAGQTFTCAVTAGGSVSCWGKNHYGQLGTGSTVDQLAAVTPAIASGAQRVEAGYFHACAVMAGGNVRCWGRNESGQVGAGTTNEMELTPVDVAGLSGIVEVTLGESHTCALTDAGAVKCWGNNWASQLGLGTSTEEYNTPQDVVGLGSGVLAIAAGRMHTCALTVGGGVKCWGENHEGAVGDGTTLPAASPVDVTGLASGVAAIAVGDSHSCAALAAGGMMCWGDNYLGKLGTGDWSASPTPVPVSDITERVIDADAAGWHTCALLESGALMCWGRGDSGQIGNGALRLDVTTPDEVTGLSSGVLILSSGGAQTCAVLDTGVLVCWGSNAFGILNDGVRANALEPVAVACPD